MKNISRPFNYSFLLLLGIALFNSCKNNSTKPMVSFYEVRLICHADTTWVALYKPDVVCGGGALRTVANEEI